MAAKNQTEKTVSDAALRRISLDSKLVKQYRKALQTTTVPKKEHALLARLLAYYDIPLDKVDAFLSPTAENSLPETYSLKDSKEATELLLKNIKAGKRVGVWLDYDVDGNTSGAILDHTLKALGSDDHLLRIPNRTEGFGLNIAGVRELHKQGVEMLVVADSGTVAHTQIAEARKLGMEVIVLDHHHNKEGEALPDALVVNPNRHDETSPHGGLAAASVSYLFVRDLHETLLKHGETEKAEAIDFERLRAIAAIGIVADVVSLRDPANRYIVKEGLKALNSSRYPGVNALKDIYAGTMNQEELTAEDLAFTIGPGINAAGRLGDPTVGMNLLKSESEAEAAPLARRIKAANEERKILTEQVYLDAEQKTKEFLQENPDASFIMLEDKDWHHGIVGIVAGRIKEKYNLPTAIGYVYTDESGEERATYSVRSIEGVNFFKEALTPIQNEELDGVVKSGGHAMAAGITVMANRIDAIRDYIEDKIAPTVNAVHQDKAAEYFDTLSVADLQSSTIENVYARLEPFGQLFRRPTYLLEDVQVKGIRRVGKNNEHIQFSVGEATAETGKDAVRGGVLFRGVGSSVGSVLTSPTRTDERMDMVIEPFVRTFRGNKQLGFIPLDVANVERLNAKQSKEELIERSKNLIDHRQERAKKAAEQVESRPRKIADLYDESNQEAQRALKALFDANAIVLDTETTGLNAGADSASEANGLTQVAMLSGLHRTNNNYAPRSYNQSILPVTPAHFGWKKAADAAAAARDNAPDYQRSVYEYDISPDALGVTNTSLLRTSIEGPIEALLVGPEAQDAKPFYEIAADMAKLLQKFTPVAYNAPFDMPVLARHFSDVLDARSESGWAASEEKLEARLVIPDAHWAEWEQTIRIPLQNAFKVPAANRNLSGMQQLPESLTNPAKYHCLMHGAMVHKGFSTQQRLKHIAPEQYGVAFSQDDSAHDALDDVGPLVYMLADQYRDFGNTLPNMADLWTQLVAQAKAEGTATALENGDIQLSFGKGSEAMAGFFAAFQTVAERNPRAKAYIGIRELSEDGITLIGREKAGTKKKEYYKQARHIGVIKKTLTHNDLAGFDQVISAHAFDSSSSLDVTLKGDKEGDAPVTIENVPISSFRASTPFLKNHPEQLKPYLELLTLLGNEDRVGRVVLEENGITLKGHNGAFGDVTFVADSLEQGGDVTALADSISVHLNFLMKIGAIPGVHSTSRDITDDGSDEDLTSEDGTPLLEPRTYVRLGQKNGMLMEVREDVMSLIAGRIGVDLKALPAQLQGGAIVHQDVTNHTYLIEGTVENFREINMPLRDTSWLLHRLNNLPGIYRGESTLSDNEVTLQFRDGVPVETLEILASSHVPFTAQKASITVPLTNLMNDPFHWSNAINNQKQRVKNSRQPEPPQHLTVLRQALLDNTLTHVDFARDGNIWLSDGKHFAVPFDKGTEQSPPRIVADAKNRLDMNQSTLLSIPTSNKINHAGLRYELGKLAGLERVPSPGLTTRKDRITFTTPRLQALDEARYSNELRELAEHMQSLHLGPVEESLRQLAESDELHVPHHDSKDDYFAQARTIATWVGQHEKRLDSLYDELGGLLDKDLQSRYEQGIQNIFEDVSHLQLMEHTLRGQQERGTLMGDPAENEKIIDTVREYADALEKLAFKQERVRAGCVDVQKRLMGISEGKVSQTQSVAKAMASYHAMAMHFEPESSGEHEAEAQRWMAKIYPVTPDAIPVADTMDAEEIEKIIVKNEKKISQFIEQANEASAYEAFQMVRQFTGGVEKLWDDVKDLQRSLDFSKALIVGAVALDDEAKREQVTEATNLIQKTANKNILATLAQMEEEGAVSDIRVLDEGHISFGASEMLKDPERWASRLSELGQDSVKWPKAPYVIYDTSTLLTLLLAYKDVPDHDDIGLLAFVKDFAALGVETPVITDMVLSEFLNSAVPLTPKDIFEFDDEGKATALKYGPERLSRIQDGLMVPYSKAEERLLFLKDLFNIGNVRFEETRTAKDYLNVLRHNPKLQQIVSAQEPEMKPLVYLDDEALKTLLLSDQELYHKPIRTQRLRNDSGEVSIADAMTSLRKEHGQELPIYVRYEGNDVRGRIIQRLNEPERPYNTKLDKKYNPYNSSDHEKKYIDSFDRAALAALKDTGFQTTGGLVASLAIAMREAGVYLLEEREIEGNVSDDGNYQWVVREKGKPYQPRTFQNMYGEVLLNAGEGIGDERRYRAIKDVHASDIGYNNKTEFEIFTDKPSPLHRHLMKQGDQTLQELAERHMQRVYSFNQKYYEKLQKELSDVGRNIGRIDSALGALEHTRSAINDNPAPPREAFATRHPKRAAGQRAVRVYHAASGEMTEPKWRVRVAENTEKPDREVG